MESAGAPPLDALPQLTAAWLTAALRHAGALGAGEAVAAVGGEPFAVGVAMLSDLARLAPSYEPPAAAEREGVPSSMVVKFAASTEAKEITEAYGGYQQEVRFYRELAPRLGEAVRVGPCVYTAMDPAEQRYTLLFDDLATHSTLTSRP